MHSTQPLLTYIFYDLKTKNLINHCELANQIQLTKPTFHAPICKVNTIDTPAFQLSKVNTVNTGVSIVLTFGT